MKKIIFLVVAMFATVSVQCQFSVPQAQAQEVRESKEYPLHISLAGVYAGETFLIEKTFLPNDTKGALAFMGLALKGVFYNHPNERITLAFVGEYRGQLIVLQYMPAEFDVVRRIFLGDIADEFKKIDRAISCR